MRISTERESVWFRADALRCRVTFNGKIVQPQLLLVADDETGLLVTSKPGSPDVSIIERGVVTITTPATVVVPLPEEVPFQ